ncbi:MAG: hypothetical protein EOP36_17880 [Rubrivivax sp.]|nr:MAG: hypothetical protein EOP36_17880 [Rubrivivax sp.]
MRSLRGLSAIALIWLGQAAMAAEAVPRLPGGQPDFSGIWQTLAPADDDLEPHAGRKDTPPSAGVVEGGTIPYLPQALAVRRQNFDSSATRSGPSNSGHAHLPDAKAAD